MCSSRFAAAALQPLSTVSDQVTKCHCAANAENPRIPQAKLQRACQCSHYIPQASEIGPRHLNRPIICASISSKAMAAVQGSTADSALDSYAEGILEKYSAEFAGMQKAGAGCTAFLCLPIAICLAMHSAFELMLHSLEALQKTWSHCTLRYLSTPSSQRFALSLAIKGSKHNSMLLTIDQLHASFRWDPRLSQQRAC